MITRSELAGNPAKAFDKAYGALSGLAIGDSLGDAARKPENRANYGITTDFNKGASWSTDDTEFALLTAKTLIGCGGNLTSDIVVQAWLEDVAVQDEFKRGGASEIEAANNLRKGIRPPLSGKYNAFHMSDGSAMRIGPVGIICAGDPERAAAMAEIDASVSHYRDGIWGAQAVAVAVSMAMADASMEEIFDAIMKVIPEESWFYHAMNRAFEIVDNANGSILDAAARRALHQQLGHDGRGSPLRLRVPAHAKRNLPRGRCAGRQFCPRRGHNRRGGRGHSGREIRRLFHTGSLGGENAVSHRHLPAVYQRAGH